jgi:hypothetical protein
MLNGIKILSVMIRFLYFFSSLLYDVLDKDVHHAEALLKLGHVQIAFSILS